MFRAFAIARPWSVGTVNADTLSVLLREFPEGFELRPVFPVETLTGIPSPFGRYIAVAVAAVLIVFVGLPPDIVRMAVDAVGLDVSAFRAAPELSQVNVYFVLALNRAMVSLIVMRSITGASACSLFLLR